MRLSLESDDVRMGSTQWAPHYPPPTHFWPRTADLKLRQIRYHTALSDDQPKLLPSWQTFNGGYTDIYINFYNSL